MDKDTQYILHSCKQNPNYFTGLVNPSKNLSPSFLSNKTIKQKNVNDVFWVKTEPKWVRELVNQDSGEIFLSTDFTSSVKRKVNAVNDFSSKYASLYYHREVSLLYHTLTAVNLSNYVSIKPFIENVKYRYECLQRPVRGYIWVLECSKNFHVHYHLCTAVDRFTCTRIPEELKFEGLWGSRTGVEFVRGNVNSYLQKKGIYDYIRKQGAVYCRYQIRKQGSDVDPVDGGKLKVMRNFGKSKQFL